MAFNPHVHWTPAGFNARMVYMGQQVPPIAGGEMGVFVQALTGAIVAWAQMTMATYPPMNPANGGAAVNYTYNGAARSRNVNWQVTPQNWIAGVSVQLDVTNVL